jgi:hypothetical protein
MKPSPAQSLRAFIQKQPRALWFFLAFCFVWFMAPGLQDFFDGFFAGVDSVR